MTQGQQFFVLMAGLAFIAGAAFAVVWRETRRISSWIASALYILYGVYECYMQLFVPQASLRVDLLVLYPALLLVTLVALLRAKPARR
jgi:peptidoglycan/LPS O-acetylase OafA/YrhL